MCVSTPSCAPADRMSFSEPKWRERVQFNEDSKAQAKRAAGQRRLERSLKKCDALTAKRLVCVEKQHQLKVDYQAQVASRATQHMLDKFRETFGVADKQDKTQRCSDKAYQIRLYTKVDRDCWTNADLREWYNEKKPGEKGKVSSNQGLDSAASSFLVNNPKDTDPSSKHNKPSHYMLQCGGPHDPSGFLKNVGPSIKPELGGSQALRPKEAIPKTELELNPPHWRHWQKQLDWHEGVTAEKVASGQVAKGPDHAPAGPWAIGY